MSQKPLLLSPQVYEQRKELILKIDAEIKNIITSTFPNVQDEEKIATLLISMFNLRPVEIVLFEPLIKLLYKKYIVEVLSRVDAGASIKNNSKLSEISVSNADNSKSKSTYQENINQVETSFNKPNVEEIKLNHVKLDKSKRIESVYVNSNVSEIEKSTDNHKRSSDFLFNSEVSMNKKSKNVSVDLSENSSNIIDLCEVDETTSKAELSLSSSDIDRRDSLLNVYECGLIEEFKNALHEWIEDAVTESEQNAIKDILLSVKFPDSSDFVNKVLENSRFNPTVKSCFNLASFKSLKKEDSRSISSQSEPDALVSSQMNAVQSGKILPTLLKQNVDGTCTFSVSSPVPSFKPWPCKFLLILATMDRKHVAFCDLYNCWIESRDLSYFIDLPNVVQMILRRNQPVQISSNSLSYLFLPLNQLKVLEADITIKAYDIMGRLSEASKNLPFVITEIKRQLSSQVSFTLQNLLYESLHEGVFSNSLRLFAEVFNFVDINCIFSPDQVTALKLDFKELQDENDPKFQAAKAYERNVCVNKIVNEIKDKRVWSKEDSLKRISDSIKGSDSVLDTKKYDYAESTSMKLSLLDPYTFKRISVPARSEKCTHIQCMDLYTHIQLNIPVNTREKRLLEGKTKIQTWLCPICRLSYRPAELYIDPVISEILNSNDVPEILFANGTYMHDQNTAGAQSKTYIIDLTNPNFRIEKLSNPDESDVKKGEPPEKISSVIIDSKININSLSDKQILSLKLNQKYFKLGEVDLALRKIVDYRAKKDSPIGSIYEFSSFVGKKLLAAFLGIFKTSS